MTGVTDQLGQHGIVVDRNGIAGRKAGIDADAVRCIRRAEQRETSDGRREVTRRIFGVDTRLDGVPGDADRVLRGGQRLAGGNAQLPFDEIEVR